MPNMKPAALFFVLFFTTTAYPQSDFPQFGNFSSDEISLKQCPFDTAAEAVILLDQAKVNYDDQYHMVTYRRIRIKILNERGLDRANIVIPFYSKDDFEYLSKIEAYTFNFDANGMQPGIAVDKKSFYTEKKNNFYSLMKFAMPAVKAGSIIEYHYTSTMRHYGGLDEWLFQSDIPTVKSSYLLEILPQHEFAYSVQKKVSLPIIVKPKPDEGTIYFEMNNIAALRIEPYMDAPRNYIQKVMFQLAGFLTNSGTRQAINTTWQKLAFDLMNEKDYGSQLDKNLKIDEVENILANDTTQQARLKSIYEFVKKKIVWNGYDGKYAPDGLKAVWERKKGSAGELNLFLVNLLKTSGIETYPVLVAERDFGKIDTTYPYMDRFNKTIAFAIADGKQFLLDATQENCPAGLTPYPLLNTSGFLVDKKKYSVIKIVTGNKSYKNVIKVSGTMDAKGIITAEANVKSYDYARQLRLDAVKKNRQQFINEFFEKPYEAITIDSFLVNPPEADSLPFEQVVRFKQQLNESGSYVFINANLFTGLEKNPFTSSIRFTNVNFGYPYNVVVEERIKLPAGAKVEVPEDQVVRSADNTIEALRQVSFENGELYVFIRFVQNTTLVTPDGYSVMREHYKNMVDMLNEPIVVKLAN